MRVGNEMSEPKPLNFRIDEYRDLSLKERKNRKGISTQARRGGAGRNSATWSSRKPFFGALSMKQLGPVAQRSIVELGESA